MEKSGIWGAHLFNLFLLAFLLGYPLCSQGSWIFVLIGVALEKGDAVVFITLANAPHHRWLGITSVGVVEKMGCSNLPLSSRQKEVCRRKPYLLPSIKDGARLGIEECQAQFKHERWNCSTSSEPSVFGYELSSGTKETAFIYAIMAAGLVHSVTRSCSAGNMTECSCDTTMAGSGSASEGWHWGGCSDDINYGMWFSRRFIEHTVKNGSAHGNDALLIMKQHNSEAGRQAVAKTMWTDCRCHGVSGSCAVKTCWKTIASLQHVGKYLKERYENSVQVMDRSKRKFRRKDKEQRRMPIGKEELIFINKSPNYCMEDRQLGVAGTRGRRCNRTSAGPEGCNLLCCGRGYNTHVVRHVERCECKFIWCCYVRCRRCETMNDIHTCK